MTLGRPAPTAPSKLQARLYPQSQHAQQRAAGDGLTPRHTRSSSVPVDMSPCRARISSRAARPARHLATDAGAVQLSSAPGSSLTPRLALQRTSGSTRAGVPPACRRLFTACLQNCSAKTVGPAPILALRRPSDAVLRNNNPCKAVDSRGVVIGWIVSRSPVWGLAQPREIG
jgi:hypothetical protein